MDPDISVTRGKPRETREQVETRWKHDGVNFGYVLPAPAAWWKRAMIIRHLRWFYLMLRIERHYTECHALGLGISRSGYDEWVLYAVLTGKC